MAFSDWWTLLVGCASVLVALFLNDEKWVHDHPSLRTILWTVTGVVFIVCLVAFMRQRRTSSKGDITSKQGNSGDSNSSGVVGSIGSIGAHATVNIGVSHEGVPSQPRTLPSVKEPAVPHFTFVGLKHRQFFVSSDPHRGVHEPITPEEAKAAIPGFVAQFTNVSQNGMSRKGFNVIAKLRFFSDDWVRSKDIEYGVWIGSAAESTDIDFGHTEELFLVCELGGEKFCLRDRRKNSQYYREWGEDISYLEEVTIDNLPNVQIMIIDGRTHAFQSWMLRIETQGLSATCQPIHPPPSAGLLPQ